MVSLDRLSATDPAADPAAAPRQRGAERFLLLLAALVSAAGSSALPADGPHPLALLLCLLPLPMALLASRLTRRR